jgi:hypothetical protein
VNYSFDVEVATKYGVDEAIMIQNFQFWIFKNKAGEKNQHDGRTWTFNTIKALETIFPFWSVKQIRRVMKSLIDNEILVTGNYNQKGYDQTTWYAFKDEQKWLEPLILKNCPNGQMELPKRANGIAQTGKPIPDNKQQIENTDITTTATAEKHVSEKEVTKKTKKQAFIQPTLAEVTQYCVEKSLAMDAGKFIDHYETVGWVYGKGRSPIKDWKAAVRNWARREEEFNEQKQKSPASAVNRKPGHKQPMQFPDYSSIWEEKSEGNFIDSTFKVLN